MVCDVIGQRVTVQYERGESEYRPPIVVETTYFSQWIDFPPVYVYWDKDRSLTKRPNRPNSLHMEAYRAP